MAVTRFSYRCTKLRLPRSRVRMSVRVDDGGSDGDEAFFAVPLFTWRLDKSSRRPIDNKDVVKARGGGRWIKTKNE